MANHCFHVEDGERGGGGEGSGREGGGAKPTSYHGSHSGWKVNHFAPPFPLHDSGIIGSRLTAFSTRLWRLVGRWDCLRAHLKTKHRRPPTGYRCRTWGFKAELEDGGQVIVPKLLSVQLAVKIRFLIFHSFFFFGLARYWRRLSVMFDNVT